MTLNDIFGMLIRLRTKEADTNIRGMVPIGSPKSPNWAGRWVLTLMKVCRHVYVCIHIKPEIWTMYHIRHRRKSYLSVRTYFLVLTKEYTHKNLFWVAAELSESFMHKLAETRWQCSASSWRRLRPCVRLLPCLRPRPHAWPRPCPQPRPCYLASVYYVSCFKLTCGKVAKTHSCPPRRGRRTRTWPGVRRSRPYTGTPWLPGYVGTA